MFQKQIYGFGNKINHKYGFTKNHVVSMFLVFYEFFFEFRTKISSISDKMDLAIFSLYSHLMSSCVFDDVMPISF